MIKIISVQQNVVNGIITADIQRLGVVRGIIFSEMRQELNGEYTLDFEAALTEDNKTMIQHGTMFEAYGQYFIVGSLDHTINDDGQLVVKCGCDHVVCSLNRRGYDFSLNLNFEDIPATTVFAKILQGTIFTGSIFTNQTVSLQFSEGSNRLEALTSLRNAVRGEFVWDNYSVSIVAHRGSTLDDKVAIVGKNVTKLSRTIDKRTRPSDESKSFLVTYDCEIIESLDDYVYQLGDNVRIIDRDIGIDSVERVLSISANPDDETQPRIIILGDIEKPKLEDEIKEEQDDEDPTDEEPGPPGEPGPDGPEGPPGPKGEPGEDAEPTDELRSKISNISGTQVVECGDTGITVTSAGDPVNFNLGTGQNGMTIVIQNAGTSGGMVGKFDFLPKISDLEQSASGGSASETASIECTDNNIKFTSTNGAVNLDLTDTGGDVLQKQMVNNVSTLKFAPLEKIANASKDAESGNVTENSAVICGDDRLTFKIGDNEIITDLSNGVNGDAVLYRDTGTVKGLVLAPLSVLQTPAQESLIQCLANGIQLAIGADSYILDLSNGSNGQMLTLQDGFLKFLGPAGDGFEANVIITTELPDANLAEEGTLYILYDYEEG